MKLVIFLIGCYFSIGSQAEESVSSSLTQLEYQESVLDDKIPSTTQKPIGPGSFVILEYKNTACVGKVTEFYKSSPSPSVRINFDSTTDLNGGIHNKCKNKSDELFYLKNQDYTIENAVEFSSVSVIKPVIEDVGLLNFAFQEKRAFRFGVGQRVKISMPYLNCLGKIKKLVNKHAQIEFDVNSEHSTECLKLSSYFHPLTKTTAQEAAQ